MTQQTPAIFSNRGLASYGEASPEYELAPLGIASMRDQVQRLAEFGRNGDIYVIHAAEGETVIPMEVLDENPRIKALLFNQMAEMGLDPQRYVVGDQLNSLNPVTGMPEFFISSIWRGVKKAVKSVLKIAKKIAPIALPLIGATIGLPFFGPMFAAGSMASMALTSGIGTLIGGGSLKDSFKSALIAGGTAGIMGGLKGWAGAPEGTGFSGFGAGVKSAWTGQVPVYSRAGTLIGTEDPYSWGEIWDEPSRALGGRKYVPTKGDFSPLVNPDMTPDPNIRPASSTLYLPRVTGGAAAPVAASIGSGYTAGVKEAPDTGWSLKNFFGGADKKAAAVDPAIAKIARAEKILERSLTAPEKFKIIQTTSVADAGGSMFGDWSPTKMLGLSEKGSTAGDVALGLGATSVFGGFDTAEQEKITRADIPPLGGPRLTPDERQEAADKQQLSRNATDPYFFTTNPDVLQPSRFVAAGGSVNYPERDLLVEGPGTEKSDDIPAMLSDGEFVINSQAVRGADPSGGGNRYAGAQNLYNIMRNFEMRA